MAVNTNNESPYLDEDARKEFAAQLNSRLKKIPQDFQSPNFNPLSLLVKILQSPAEQRNEKLNELENYFDSMDSAMNATVDGSVFFF